MLAATRLPRAAGEHSSAEVLKWKSPVWDSKFPKFVPCLDEDALLDRPPGDVASASATRLPHAGEHQSVEVCNAVL